MQIADIPSFQKYMTHALSTIDKPPDGQTFRYILKIFLLAAAYYLTAKWGLSLSPVHGFATFVWPPTGIALAALLIFGQKVWPGIFIGAFTINLLAGASAVLALAIATGNTLAPVTGVYLLKRFNFDRNLERVRDVVLLVGIAALLSTLISSTTGTTSLLISGGIQIQDYPFTWITWWVGDSLGMLVIAPLLLVWLRKFKVQYTNSHLIEAGALFIVYVGVAILIFDAVPDTDPVLAGAPYLIFSFLIWASLRFNIRYITLLIFLLSAMTIWSARYGVGPFYSESLRTSLFASQLFIGATAVTFMILNAVISERHNAQGTVQLLNTQLQKTLSQTTEKLRRERELEKLRDEFVATASHELKTPVTSIKAYAQILQKTLRASNKEPLQLAESINNQADIITQRVNELLDVSKVVDGKVNLNIAVCDLNILLSQILTDFALVANSHTVVLKGTAKSLVLADTSRIEQVVINLLTNAVKYSPPNTRVSVQVKSKKSVIIVSVADRGPGIAAKDHAKIFKRFYRTEDNVKSKHAVSGMGLGLYIALEIIKQHKGKMWVDSRVGKGSVFSFSLPVYLQDSSNS